MKPELIVALDVDTIEKAEKLITILSPSVKLFKIGSQLFTRYGPQSFRAAEKNGCKVFLDLKFHDIPTTVENAVKSATVPPIFMLTVHILGGREMLQSAVKGAEECARALRIPRPSIVGVTVLTSESLGDKTLPEVIRRARIAGEAGLDGVVCSVQETAAVRKEFGPDFIIVNPGIRPAGAEKGDQKRTATPADAKRAGADYIVVGRPIVGALDPLKAAQGIIKELEGA
jgi:orotidine-5'-phosphate decarboxylase